MGRIFLIYRLNRLLEQAEFENDSTAYWAFLYECESQKAKVNGLRFLLPQCD